MLDLLGSYPRRVITAFMVVVLCGCKAHASNDSLLDAVWEMDLARVHKLVEAGADIEVVDRKRQTPIIIAAKTDQFRMAEYLIGQGADIWSASNFGWTLGYAAQTSRLKYGPEAEARERVLDILKAHGYPFPAPAPAEVTAMLAANQWPPARRVSPPAGLRRDP